MSSKLEKHFAETETRQSLDQSVVASQFASELKKPEQGSHFQKLKSIMGALILSGSIVFSPGTAKSMEMGVTPERMVYQRVLDANHQDAYPQDEENCKLMIKIIQQLKEKGGIQEICGSERIFKSGKSADQVRKLAEDAVNEGKIPYYLKLENIFGSNFIKNNPEKSKEWFEKIEPVIKATVLFFSNEIYVQDKCGQDERVEKRSGSGVIIQTKKGLRILTCAHVAEDMGGDMAKIELFGGGKAIGRMVAKDAAKELALYEIIQAAGSQEKLDKSLKSIDPLEIEDPKKFLKKSDTIASVGFPLGFPWEVFLQKPFSIYGRGCTSKDRRRRGVLRETKSVVLYATPDERFRSLAYFEQQCDDLSEGEKHERFSPRGRNAGGMSGGPVINLNSAEKNSKLIGINVATYDAVSTSKDYDAIAKNILSGIHTAGQEGGGDYDITVRDIKNVSISAISIIEFLRSEGFHD